MTYTYLPKGVCSSKIEVELDSSGVVTDIAVHDGCDGNLRGLCKLILGQNAQDVAQRLQGIRCNSKRSSCPDQVSAALFQALEEQKKSSTENT